MDSNTIAILITTVLESSIFILKLAPIYYLLPLSCLLVTYTTIGTTTTLHKLFIKHTNGHNVYLVDYSCLTPNPNLRVPIPWLLEHFSLTGCFSKESVRFMSNVVTSSGLGDETYLPPALRSTPPSTRLIDCLAEAQLLLFPIFEDLLTKTNLKPRDIDILVVSCSIFCPSPSLSSIVVNHFNMRDDTKSFNISGTGCSGGAVAVDLASHLLKAADSSRPCYAVVLSAEVLPSGFYPGQDPGKQLVNCTFRMGSSALLLTNTRTANASKYQLVNMVRTNHAYDDTAYNVSQIEEDACGIPGFAVKSGIMRVVKEVVVANATALGKQILPLDEKVRFILWHMKNRIHSYNKGCSRPEPFVPNFGRVIQHYCFPSINKAVIEEIARGLGLGERDSEAALATFRRFGNQSASSMWYQVAYMEGRGRVKRGDRVWMIAFGSGCKCNSMVWKCIAGSDRMKRGFADGPWYKINK